MSRRDNPSLQTEQKNMGRCPGGTGWTDRVGPF